MVTVVSLGGSIVAPDGVDEAYVSGFAALVEKLLREDAQQRFIFVVGGGGPARAWQKAYRGALDLIAQKSTQAETGAGARAADAEAADWIGIMATRLNAQLVKAVFGPLCADPVVINPTKPGRFSGRVLVAAGWKPGFSTDNDAVLLAKKFKAKTVINLSNIEKVYTADPKTDPNAKPIDTISWKEFRAIVGDEWSPGKNVPFDPVASRAAEKYGLSVICAAGKDLDNLQKIIHGESFSGTTIGGC